MRLFFFILLLPMAGFAKEKPYVILDAGHGGKDQGAKILGLEEKKLTLRTTYLVKKHLESLGYRVILTRARDVYLPLSTRVVLGNRRTPALFVSIHYNSAASPGAKGIEVYYYGSGDPKRRGESRKLAAAVLDGMIGEAKAHSRGTKKGNFQVIRESQIPAILVEAGFLTNREERALIATQTYLDKLAKGVAIGVDRYLK